MYACLQTQMCPQGRERVVKALGFRDKSNEAIGRISRFFRSIFSGKCVRNHLGVRSTLRHRRSRSLHFIARPPPQPCIATQRASEAPGAFPDTSHLLTGAFRRGAPSRVCPGSCELSHTLRQFVIVRRVDRHA